jgi:hypothetical protein
MLRDVGVGKSGGEIENEDFGVVPVAEIEVLFIGQQCGIAGVQQVAIDDQATADEMHVGLARRVERQARRFGAVEQPGVDGGIGMDGQRPGGAVGRSDQAQAAALLDGGKCRCS